MNTFDVPSVDETNTLAPEIDSLPGRCVPYLISDGEGDRFHVGGQLVNVIARPADTGGQFGAAHVFGGPGTETPFLRHREEHRFLYVTDGRLRIWLPEETQLLTRGDSVAIPSGIAYAYRIEAHRTRFLSWLTGGRGVEWLQAVGRPTATHVYDLSATDRLSAARATELADEFGVDVVDLKKHDRPSRSGVVLPDGPSPFVLRSGEGDRWTMTGSLNTFLTRGRNTSDTYFAVNTVGGRSPYIPRHFHRLHTENFFCMDGRILLYVNGKQLLLTKGDFVHAPAGTIHSFAFEATYTQMLGMLTTSVFEKFFEYMGDPTESYVWGDATAPPMEGFARAQAELDLQVVGPPPERR